jgi:hypothetical protein
MGSGGLGCGMGGGLLFLITTLFFILFLDLGFFVMFFTRLYFNLWLGFFWGLCE